MNVTQNNDDVNAVLSALKEVYQEKKSYEQIQMADLVNKSGVALGTIYANFTDKDDIVIELIRKNIYDIFVTFDEEVTPGMSLGERLKIFISLQLEFLGPDYYLIKEVLPRTFIPFSSLSGLLKETKARYLAFLTELFLNNFNKSSFLLKKVTLPALTNSFMLFNISVLKYWEKDSSEGKQSTLNFMEKGVKNFMVISALL